MIPVFVTLNTFDIISGNNNTKIDFNINYIIAMEETHYKNTNYTAIRIFNEEDPFTITETIQEIKQKIEEAYRKSLNILYMTQYVNTFGGQKI